MLAMESDPGFYGDFPQPDRIKAILEKATALAISGSHKEALELFREARRLMLEQEPTLGGAISET